MKAIQRGLVIYGVFGIALGVDQCSRGFVLRAGWEGRWSRLAVGSATIP